MRKFDEYAWLNKNTTLFMIDCTSETLYMGSIGVSRIWSQDGAVFCELYGRLPYARALENLPRIPQHAFDLEICHRKCGRPDDYSIQTVIMKMVGCVCRGWRIPDPVALVPEDADAITIFAVVEISNIIILDDAAVEAIMVAEEGY